VAKRRPIRPLNGALSNRQPYTRLGPTASMDPSELAKSRWLPRDESVSS
jgi:hypothetical protein